MTEWYVLCESQGSGAWHPTAVVLGRRPAIDALTAGYRLTPDEARRTRRFMEGGVCDLGCGLMVVGPEDAPNRRITRVTGPGTEV